MIKQFGTLMLMKLNISVVNKNIAMACRRIILCQSVLLCVQEGSRRREDLKISKQSALAVKHYLRDNQHQSPGRPGYALA